jgi:hypothetical protein
MSRLDFWCSALLALAVVANSNGQTDSSKGKSPVDGATSNAAAGKAVATIRVSAITKVTATPPKEEITGTLVSPHNIEIEITDDNKKKFEVACDKISKIEFKSGSQAQDVIWTRNEDKPKKGAITITGKKLKIQIANNSIRVLDLDTVQAISLTPDASLPPPPQKTTPAKTTKTTAPEMPPPPKSEAPVPVVKVNPGPPPPDPNAAHLRLCKPTVAFSMMPTIRQIYYPSRLKLPDRAVNPDRLDEEKLNQLEPWAHFLGIPLHEYRFHVPAHFPLPQFGILGEPIPEDGAVIYEGMRVLIAADGHYEVRFTTSVPDMPVTLRLQLLVADTNGPLAFTLTLPPISILAPDSFRGNYDGSAFQVRLAGYSRLLAEQFGNLPRFAISRQGTARFGSWPQGINRFEQLQPIGLPPLPGTADSTSQDNPNPPQP